ncbi:MAG: DUF4097 family beta strand repeat-containing protein [Gemmatimonadales bacterium]
MRFLLLAALVVAAGPLAAQRTPVVRLVNVAGPLVLNGWDRDSVAVRGAARLAVSGPKDAIRVDGSGAGTDAAEVFVPRHARIEVRGGGALDATGLDGELEVSAATGRVRVEGALRRVMVETFGGGAAAVGNVEIVGPHASVEVRTPDGTVVVRGVRGELQVTTTSGEIFVGAARVRRARLESVSGAVSFKGVVDRAGTLEAQSHSGDVELRVPPDVAATFELAAPTGTVRSEFDSGSGTSRRFSTGDGGASIVARSFKGQVSVVKQPGADVDLNASGASGIR